MCIKKAEVSLTMFNSGVPGTMALSEEKASLNLR
jgi:hypothetical protein